MTHTIEVDDDIMLFLAYSAKQSPWVPDYSTLLKNELSHRQPGGWEQRMVGPRNWLAQLELDGPMGLTLTTPTEEL